MTWHRSRIVVVTVTVAAATVLSGCSQVAVLQPVAGDGVTAVNNATSDVLASEQVDVMTWPVCDFADNTYTCTGETLDGQPIKATATGDEDQQLTVTVGGRTIYQGPVQSVLDEAGRVS